LFSDILPSLGMQMQIEIEEECELKNLIIALNPDPSKSHPRCKFSNKPAGRALLRLILVLELLPEVEFT
jgi:hypothetical protein